MSFVTGGFLIVGGAFAGWKAFKINKRYFPVSQVPTLAGLQQFMEGHVWMGVNNADPTMVWWAAMGFIFFSWLILSDGTHKTVESLAQSVGVHPKIIRSGIRMAFLAPKVTKAILEGDQAPNLRLKNFSGAVPLAWSGQQTALDLN